MVEETVKNLITWGEALDRLINGVANKITRIGWKNENISISLQLPDENSKMTKAYLYMNKYGDKFPSTISCESELANDWYVLE